MPRKAVIRYNHTKVVTMAISTVLRDFLKFDGLNIEVFEDVLEPKSAGEAKEDEGKDEEGKHANEPKGKDAKDAKEEEPPRKKQEMVTKSYKLGQGPVQLHSFLDPILHREADGIPSCTQDVTINARRSPAARGEDSKIPEEEVVVVQVSAVLNEQDCGWGANSKPGAECGEEDEEDED